MAQNNKAQPRYQPTAEGERLRRTRESQGISLEVVHEVTKIPMDVLRAIEEGYTVRTLSPFYYKGFLKIYARYLKMDIQEVITDYKPEKLPEPMPSPENRDTINVLQKVREIFSSINKRQLLKVFVVIFVLLLLSKMFAFFKHRKPAPVHKMPVHREPAPAKTAQAQRKMESPKAPPTSAKEKKESVVASPPKLTTATATTTPAVPAQSVLPEGPVKKNVSLVVRAKKDGWLQVKVDEGIVFQGVLNQGIAETWLANEAIELSGKNLNQLEFELNGKMIGALGREDRGAKKVVITKDGLSVKK